MKLATKTQKHKEINSVPLCLRGKKIKDKR